MQRVEYTVQIIVIEDDYLTADEGRAQIIEDVQQGTACESVTILEVNYLPTAASAREGE